MSRAEVIARAAWRGQVIRSDGTVRTEILRSNGAHADGFEVRRWFETVVLQSGERAEYQIRHPGKARFLTWGRR